MIPDAARYPGQAWEMPALLETIGWSNDLLSRAMDYAGLIGSRAVMIVINGAALAMWGDVARPFNCRSIRKALLSALYGVHVAEGHIDLAWTLADLGMDDTEPALSAEEKQATIADLLTSRSGVYHPANYVPPAERARLPARGSHAPGTFWHYNNWDFNALLTIFEQCTGTRIFEEFERRIAQPLQMQDYRAHEMKYVTQPHSLHPLYSFRLSARDLARFGLLYLRQGQWQDQQMLSREWVAASTTAQTPARGGTGFGYLWWVCVDGNLFHGVPLPAGSFASYGMGGQFLLVIPAFDLVIVHLTNPDDPTSQPPTGEPLTQLLRLTLAARLSSGPDAIE
ncbi:MAG TPA: serine hydrolase [Ktedonobacterales bacterium]|nr:serine hydrolase [Ktedonobacterales bacterium]